MAINISRNRLSSELESLVRDGKISVGAADTVARLVVSELEALDRRIRELEDRLRMM